MTVPLGATLGADVTAEPTSEEAAEATLDYYISEINRLREQMQRDQAEIDRDAAETRVVLAQLKKLLPD